MLFSRYQQDQLEEKLLTDSLSALDPGALKNMLFNFYANPANSFRNLIMNTGFVRLTG